MCACVFVCVGDPVLSDLRSRQILDKKGEEKIKQTNRRIGGKTGF